MDYLSYKKADIINGYGMRVVIWLPYCSHACKGCFNKDSWYGGGIPITNEFVEQLIVDLSQSYIKGITFSGGDPIHKKNYKWVLELCKRIRNELPEKDIMIYTGYTYKQMLADNERKEILLWCDLLMDGKFEIDFPTTKTFRGSDRQVLHTLEGGISVKQA